MSEKLIAGEPGSTRRSHIRAECKPMGPIGLLLESAHMLAASIDEKMVIRRYNEQDLDIMKMPFQRVQPAIRKLCQLTRTADSQDTRLENTGLREIDDWATPAETRKWMRKTC